MRFRFYEIIDLWLKEHRPDRKFVCPASSSDGDPGGWLEPISVNPRLHYPTAFVHGSYVFWFGSYNVYHSWCIGNHKDAIVLYAGDPTLFDQFDKLLTKDKLASLSRRANDRHDC